MRIVGLSREGCRVILPLSVITLFLGDIAQHSFAPKWETAPFFALILLSLLRLMLPERKGPKTAARGPM